MRFSEFCASSGDEVAEALANALTLGSGRLAYAARLVTDDGEAGGVVRSLDRAIEALLQALQLLGDQAADAVPAPDLTDTPVPPSHHWEEFLASRTTATEATAFRTALIDALERARYAGTALLEDSDIETIALQVAAAVTALREARRIVI